MTVILAMSDSQIGSGRNLATDRLGDQEAVLNQIAELADSEGAELLLHCGDLFDSRTPSDEARMVAKRFFKRVSADRDVVAIAGNHCLRNASLPSAVDLYDGIDFVREPRVIQTRAGAVACLPWAPPGHYIASRNGASREQLNAEIAELVMAVASDLREQCGDGPAILAGHWMVSGGSLPNGLPVSMLGGPVLPLPDLEDLGFDLCLFGDVHVPERLGAEGFVISVGSPWLNDFGEEGIPHGVWIIDDAAGPNGDEGDIRFVQLVDRTFRTVDVDLTDKITRIALDMEPTGLDETDAVAAKLAEHVPLTDATVRLRVKATAEQIRRVDFAAIRKLADDTGVHRLVIAPPEIERVERARVEGVTETLSVPEALDLYIEHNEVGAHGEALRVLTGELLDEVSA